jgi:hypothetical protein
MSLRRSLSDVTVLEMRVQSVEVENAQLKERVALLERGALGQVAVHSTVEAVAPATMAELLLQEEGVQSKRKAKKTRKNSKRDLLKNVRPGELLTQPAIIEALKQQEEEERAKTEKKAVEKRVAQALKKKTNAEDQLVKKKAKAAEGGPARGKRKVAEQDEGSSKPKRKKAKGGE